MEHIDANYIIIGGASVIILSYLFNLIAKRTSIPSVLMLIFMGIITMLITREFSTNFLQDKNFNTLLSVLGTVGLILIVLEASLDLKLKENKIRSIFLSLLIALLGVLITTFALSVIFRLALETDWVTAVFHAIPLSIISSAIVMPSIHNLVDKKREFLIYESAFSDILGIMAFYFFKDNIGQSSAGKIIVNIGSNVVLTILLAVVASYILIIVLQKITTHVKFFLLIAVLFIIYSTGKLMHLSPLLVIMFFGIIINNQSVFFRGFLKKWINQDIYGDLLGELKTMTAETAFLVRTFFFFIFGLSIQLDSLLSLEAILLSVLVLAAIFLSRIGLFAAFLGKEGRTQRMIAPRGLISILLFFQIPMQFQTLNSYTGILLIVILASSIIMSTVLIRNKKGSEEISEEVSSEEADDIDPKLRSDATTENHQDHLMNDPETNKSDSDQTEL